MSENTITGLLGNIQDLLRTQNKADLATAKGFISQLKGLLKESSEQHRPDITGLEAQIALLEKSLSVQGAMQSNVAQNGQNASQQDNVNRIADTHIAREEGQNNKISAETSSTINVASAAHNEVTSGNSGTMHVVANDQVNKAAPNQILSAQQNQLEQYIQRQTMKVFDDTEAKIINLNEQAKKLNDSVNNFITSDGKDRTDLRSANEARFNILTKELGNKGGVFDKISEANNVLQNKSSNEAQIEQAKMLKQQAFEEYKKLKAESFKQINNSIEINGINELTEALQSGDNKKINLVKNNLKQSLGSISDLNSEDQNKLFQKILKTARTNLVDAKNAGKQEAQVSGDLSVADFDSVMNNNLKNINQKFRNASEQSRGMVDGAINEVVENLKAKIFNGNEMADLKKVDLKSALNEAVDEYKKNHISSAKIPGKNMLETFVKDFQQKAGAYFDKLSPQADKGAKILQDREQQLDLAQGF